MIGKAQFADASVYDYSAMVDDPAYLTLRKHLTVEEREAIEGDGSVRVFVGHAPILPPVKAATDAVDRIEKEWGLA